MQDLIIALKAAGEITRLRILALLRQGELTVSEICYILKQSQPRISRHLRLLSEAGLVVRFPEGSWVFYRLVTAPPKTDLISHILSQIPDLDEQIQKDNKHLADVRQERATRAEAYFAENAARWNEVSRHYISEKQIVTAIKKQLSHSFYEHFVDIGTGTGFLLKSLASKATQATGFDISASMLAIARNHLEEQDFAHCQVRQADASSLPLQKSSADLVTIHQLLHFLPEPQSVISEAARILKPQGQLIIVDFAPHQREELREQHAHRRLGFADEEIISCLQNAGLETKPPLHLQSKSATKHNLTVTLWQAVNKGEVI